MLSLVGFWEGEVDEEEEAGASIAVNEPDEPAAKIEDEGAAEGQVERPTSGWDSK